MANSKLLKEAIADAKAVRETAIANAKIALEEAFTPRLQSILSKKLQAEMEGDEEEIEEELDSSDIGNGDEESPVEPSADASDAHTELGPESEEESDEVGEEDENVDVVSEEEDHEEEVHEEDEVEVEEEDEVEVEDEIEEEDEIEDEDELDLEAIIRELEGELEDDSEYEETYEGEEEEYEEGTYEGEGHDEEEVSEESPAHDAVGFEDPTNADDASIEEEEDEEETIDLEEILREMGYGDDEEEVSEEEHEEEDHSELEEELENAYATIKELQSTINEVNLLNAKLLYANKLFRGYSLTNEQKAKVVENLDRTSSVREVKLVYATLAESMNFTGTEKKSKRAISESVAPKATKSTAPVKEVITESADALAERFKKLANIK